MSRKHFTSLVTILAALLVFTSSAFAESATTQASSNITVQFEGNQVSPFATRYVSNYEVTYLISVFPEVSDLPEKVWYEKDGFGGYLKPHKITKEAILWRVNYSGYIYSID